MGNILQLRRDLSHTSFRFLMTETDLALTFVKIASATKNRETKVRNLRNARSAYKVILRMRDRFDFDSDEVLALGEEINRLRSALMQLEEELTVRDSP